MKKLALGALLIMVSNVVSAAVGSAGCGLGSVIWGSRPSAQLFAMSTNHSTSTQFSGISLGTSQCVYLYASVQFIENNMHALKHDAAKGEGETLNSLASFYKVGNTAAFNAALKAGYEEIFSSNDSEIIEAKILAVAQHINA